MKFSNDQFKARRGGTSKWLMVSCRECQNDLFIYQKDGTGQLLRLYLDRIYSSPEGERPFKNITYQALGNLACNNCESLIGVPMIYEKHGEDRLAERIIPPGPLLKVIKANQIESISINPIETIIIENEVQ